MISSRIVVLLAVTGLSAAEEPEELLDEDSDGANATPFAATEAITERALVKPFEWLEERTKSELGLSLDTLFLASLGGGEVEPSASLDATFHVERPIFGSLLENNLTLYGRMRVRSAILDDAPADLSDDIGTIWGVVDGFSDSGFEIPDLFLRHIMPDRNLELRYGQMVIDAQLDGRPIGGSKTAFLNRAFSASPGAAFPRSGAGATVAWDPDGPWDLVYAITTVQGSQESDQVDFQFGSSDYFQAFQVGYTFPGGRIGPRRAQVMVWHSGPAPDSKLDAGEGISFTYSHRFNEPIRSAFCRVAFAAGEASAASFMLVGGFTTDYPTDAVTGIGIGVGNSSLNDDWNGVVEGFYRKPVGSHGSVRLNGQLIIGEGFADSGAVRLLLGASARCTF